MFQSNVEGVQNTELRVCTEDLHIGVPYQFMLAISSQPLLYTFMYLDACSVVRFWS